MATSPMRVRDEDKAEFERLRETVAQAARARPTQQELFAQLLAFVTRHRDAFLREVVWQPLGPAARTAWHARASDLGSWSTAEIDDIVYGPGP